MTSIPPRFVFDEVGAECIDAVRPLWEKLRAHHAQLSRHFGSEMRRRTFELRKQELLAKAKGGRLKIDLVYECSGVQPVAYCATGTASDGSGEVDSIFVEEHVRNCGIGTELMRRPLAWLDGHGVTSKVVSVAYGNDEVLMFYARFGFFPRAIVLRQVDESADRPAT